MRMAQLIWGDRFSELGHFAHIRLAVQIPLSSLPNVETEPR